MHSPWAILVNSGEAPDPAVALPTNLHSQISFRTTSLPLALQTSPSHNHQRGCFKLQI